MTLYHYDAQDQLIRITFPNQTEALYRYDALGRRIEKAVAGQVTRYVYDGEDIVLQYDGVNNLTARYAHGAETDQPLVLEQASGQTWGQTWQSYFYHADHLGSIRKITDAAGNVVNSYDYDAYGRILQKSETVAQPYAFTGREYDAESGLLYYRARYYDSETGRFLSEDPLGFAAGDLNLYRYVWNDPVNWVDPSGFAGVARTGGGTVGAAYVALAAAAATALTPQLQDIGCSIGSIFGQIALHLERATGIQRSGCGAIGVMPMASSAAGNDAQAGAAANAGESDKPADEPKKGKKASNSDKGDKVRTPDTHPDDFYRRKDGKWVNRNTGEVWDKSHTTHSGGKEWKVGSKPNQDPTRGNKITVGTDGTIIKIDP